MNEDAPLNGDNPKPTLNVHISKRADDPTGTVRVSVGGVPENLQIYCIYRSSKERAIEALKMALHGMMAMAEACRELGAEEPDIEPDHPETRCPA